MNRIRRLPVVADWFTTETLADGTVLLGEPHLHPLLRANIWLVPGRDRDLLVDAGNGVANLQVAVARLRPDPHKPLIAVLTHAHEDHMGSLHQFAERVVHPLEAAELERPSTVHPLLGASYPEEIHRAMAAEGLPLPQVLVTALPRPGFDPASFELRGCAPTRLVDEGDTIDLGDRLFRVLHLPGHSPGGIGLLEEDSGVFFSGDVVYDGGGLLDDLPGADIERYVGTMRRLRDLPVSIVQAGHEASFDRERLVEIVDEYVSRRERP